MYKGMYRDAKIWYFGKRVRGDQDYINRLAFEVEKCTPKLVPSWLRPFLKVWDWVKSTI